jgi:two-component system response regulator
MVVLIDDNPDDLLLMKRALVKAGAANPIHTFPHAVPALQFLAAELATPPHPASCGAVVFCDLKMPDVDGFDFLRRIRAEKFSAAIRVIIVSGCALESDVEQARELGADGYLEKMPAGEVLLASLARPFFTDTGSRPERFERWESRTRATVRPCGRTLASESAFTADRT